MKGLLGIAVVAGGLLVTGAAQAQGYGGVRSYGSGAATPSAREEARRLEQICRIYDPPYERSRAPRAAPAEPGMNYPTDRSVLSDPRYMYPKPTRDCELSVYVNACGKRR